MKRHDEIMTELHLLLESLEAVTFGSDASTRSVCSMNSLLTKSGVGLNDKQRFKFFEALLEQFPNRPWLSPYREAGQLSFEFLSTSQFIQPVVSKVIDWLKVPGDQWVVRPEAAQAVIAVAYGEVGFPDD